MTKKDIADRLLASIVSRLKNLQDEKERLIAELMSFLKTLDKDELKELSYCLKQTQIPELKRGRGRVARDRGGEGGGSCNAGSAYRLSSLITQPLQLKRCQSAIDDERRGDALNRPEFHAVQGDPPSG